MQAIRQILTASATGVLLVTGVVYATGGAPKLLEEAAERRFWAVKSTAVHSYDAVVLGDSRAYRGLDPKVIEEETGLRAINLGFSSAGFSRSLFALADRHLRTSGERRVVILAVTPFSFTARAARKQHILQWAGRSKAHLFEVAWLEHLLIFLSPDALKAISPRPLSNPYFQTFHDSGFIESDRAKHEVEEGVAAYREQFAQHKVSRKVIDGLMEQIGAWQGQGIRVVAYRPPVSSGVRRIEDAQSGWDDQVWKAELDAFGVRWTDFGAGRFEAYDGSHLTGPEARRLTREVVRILLRDP